MAVGDEYLDKAAELSELAERENNPDTRAEFEKLSRAFFRLALHAKRNSHVDSICKSPKLDDSEVKK